MKRIIGITAILITMAASISGSDPRPPAPSCGTVAYAQERTQDQKVAAIMQQIVQIQHRVECKNEVITDEMHVINVLDKFMNAYLGVGGQHTDEQIRSLARIAIQAQVKMLASPCMREETKP
jgi:hypothetical protein